MLLQSNGIGVIIGPLEKVSLHVCKSCMPVGRGSDVGGRGARGPGISDDKGRE